MFTCELFLIRIRLFLKWDYLAYASAIFPGMMIALLIPLPESPNWLSDQNRHDEVDKALKWLNRKDKKEPAPQIFTIPRSVEDTSLDPSNTVLNILTKKRPSLEVAKELVKGPYSVTSLTQKSVMIPFGLVVAILVFQQISGIDTVIFYTVSIFNSSHSSIDDYTATIIVGLVQVVATFVSVFIIDHTGRKPLLLISGSIMGISMALLGGYFHLKEVDPETASRYAITPVISLILFMASFSIGYCNIPFLLMGELLPLAQRSFLSSVAGALNLGSMFLVIKTYPDIQEMVGAKGVFWLYAFFCFASCLFVLSFLPETKKKTLEEIEEHFELKNKNSSFKNTEQPADDVTIEDVNKKAEKDSNP